MTQSFARFALLVCLSAGCVSVDGLRDESNGREAGGEKGGQDRGLDAGPDVSVDVEHSDASSRKDATEDSRIADRRESDPVGKDANILDVISPDVAEDSPIDGLRDDVATSDAQPTDGQVEDIAPDRRPAPPAYGLDGPYTNIGLDDVWAHGVRVLLFQLSWSGIAESAAGFDDLELNAVTSEIQRSASLGFNVVLDLGLHMAPSWVKTKPNGSFVNQDGSVYAETSAANLVWSDDAREAAAQYIAHVFQMLGPLKTSLYAVRIGGGGDGTLTYPWNKPGTYHFWGFDSAARQKKDALIKDWKPGAPSPNNEARVFLDFYLNGLVGLELWQIETIRNANYGGTIAVAFGGEGLGLAPVELTADDRTAAIGANLVGGVSEGKMAHLRLGLDRERQVAALAAANATNIALWSAAAETNHLAIVVKLADQYQYLKMGENKSLVNNLTLGGTVQAARDNELSLFMWSNAVGAYCNCASSATIDDYQALIQAP